MLRNIMVSAAAAAVLMSMSAGVAEARSRHSNSYGDCRQDNRNDQVAGAVIGGILGGVVGNQVFKGERGLGTVAGMILGGVAGSQIAKSGDNCDQYYASYAYSDAFDRDPYDRVEWRNPRSGNYGYVTPAGYYRDRRGNQCRNYKQEIYINGRRQIAEGTACRNRDGTWRIVS
jgi:surface antigen